MKNVTAFVEPLLILLYVYAACSKLLNFDDFRGQLYNQAFPHALAGILLYTLPPAELITAALLTFGRTRRIALWFSLALLSAFTGYIALVLLHVWNRVPCSCGGILNHLSWNAHLAFNLCFILINLLALFGQPSGEAENREQSRHHFFI
jgi:putative oxidoreductase